MSRIGKLTTIGMVALLGAGSGIGAASIVTLSGSGFQARYDDALLGLFGTPALSGDGRTILFTPISFSATATGNPGASNYGTQYLSSSIYLDILPINGVRLSSVSVVESGDYRVVNRPNTPASNDPGVEVFGQLRATNLINGTDVLTSNLAHGALDQACATIVCAVSNWSATASVATPNAWGVGPVRLYLENVIVAESFGLADSSFIEKKNVALTFVTAPSAVPLPATMPMLLVGLAGLASLARRRRAVS